MNAEQRTLFEAEAFADAERALGSARAVANELDACCNAMRAGNVPGQRELEKVIELLRLGTVRLDVFARRLGSGRLSDDFGGGTP